MRGLALVLVCAVPAFGQAKVGPDAKDLAKVRKSGDRVPSQPPGGRRQLDEADGSWHLGHGYDRSAPAAA